MDIKGKTKVFREDREGHNGTWTSYRTSVGKKNEDGSWDNDGYEVVFAKNAKGANIPNGAVINVTNGFLSCRSYTEKGGTKKVVSQMIVMDFEMVDTPVSNSGGFGFTALTENDVPF